MALPDVGRLLSLARQADDLFKLHDTVKDGLKAVNDRMRAIEDRLLQIETQLPHIVKTSENAARTASTEALNPHLMAIGSRLARVETQLEQLIGRASKSDQPPVPKLAAPRRGRRQSKGPEQT
jgi:hypothetical protein